MATTQYFEETLENVPDKHAKQPQPELHLEFGCSTFFGEPLMYVRVDGKLVIVDRERGRRIYEAMDGLGAYLGYDK